MHGVHNQSHNCNFLLFSVVIRFTMDHIGCALLAIVPTALPRLFWRLRCVAQGFGQPPGPSRPCRQPSGLLVGRVRLLRDFSSWPPLNYAIRQALVEQKLGLAAVKTNGRETRNLLAIRVALSACWRRAGTALVGNAGPSGGRQRTTGGRQRVDLP
jgi:hypothetical protein